MDNSLQAAADNNEMIVINKQKGTGPDNDCFNHEEVESMCDMEADA